MRGEDRSSGSLFSYIDVEAIRSTYWLALWRLSEGLDARAEVRAAKWWACDAAHRVVCTAQHLHGGMGADIDSTKSVSLISPFVAAASRI